MKEKLAKVLQLVLTERDEISSVEPKEKEYYFVFRNKFFSVRRGTDGYYFYAYPRWAASVERLAEVFSEGNGVEDVSIAYLGPLDGVSASAVSRELYSYLEERVLGLDSFFSDLGVT